MTILFRLLPQDNDELLYRDFHTLTYIKGALVLFGGRSKCYEQISFSYFYFLQVMYLHQCSVTKMFMKRVFMNTYLV